MNFHKSIVYFLTSLFIFLAIAPLGALDHSILFAVSIIIYAAATILIYSKLKEKKERIVSMVILLFPVVIVLIFIHGIGNDWTHLPSTLAHVIGVPLGVLLYNAGRIRRLVYVGFVFIFLSWIYFFGYKYWLNYITFNSITGKVDQLAGEFTLKDSSGRDISDSVFRKKFLVMDFWTTSCGVCFQKFPEYEVVYNENKQNENAVFVSVNVPLKRDSSGHARYLLRKYNHSFPFYFMNRKDAEKSLGVLSYPTILVLKGNKIIYRGDEINKAEEMINRKALH